MTWQIEKWPTVGALLCTTTFVHL